MKIIKQLARFLPRLRSIMQEAEETLQHPAVYHRSVVRFFHLFEQPPDEGSFVWWIGHLIGLGACTGSLDTLQQQTLNAVFERIEANYNVVEVHSVLNRLFYREYVKQVLMCLFFRYTFLPKKDPRRSERLDLSSYVETYLNDDLELGLLFLLVSSGKIPGLHFRNFFRGYGCLSPTKISPDMKDEYYEIACVSCWYRSSMRILCWTAVDFLSHHTIQEYPRTILFLIGLHITHELLSLGRDYDKECLEAFSRIPPLSDERLRVLLEISRLIRWRKPKPASESDLYGLWCTTENDDFGPLTSFKYFLLHQLRKRPRSLPISLDFFRRKIFMCCEKELLMWLAHEMEWGECTLLVDTCVDQKLDKAMACIMIGVFAKHKEKSHPLCRYVCEAARNFSDPGVFVSEALTGLIEDQFKISLHFASKPWGATITDIHVTCFDSAFDVYSKLDSKDRDPGVFFQPNMILNNIDLSALCEERQGDIVNKILWLASQVRSRESSSWFHYNLYDNAILSEVTMRSVRGLENLKRVPLTRRDIWRICILTALIFPSRRLRPTPSHSSLQILPLHVIRSLRDFL